MISVEKFNSSLIGYDKTEVNKFVNEVTDEYEKMLNKLKEKDADIASLKQELVKYQNIESTLNKTILAAEEVSNNMRSVARSESKSILDEPSPELSGAEIPLSPDCVSSSEASSPISFSAPEPPDSVPEPLESVPPPAPLVEGTVLSVVSFGFSVSLTRTLRLI